MTFDKKKRVFFKTQLQHVSNIIVLFLYNISNKMCQAKKKI